MINGCTFHLLDRSKINSELGNIFTVIHFTKDKQNNSYALVMQ